MLSILCMQLFKVTLNYSLLLTFRISETTPKTHPCSDVAAVLMPFFFFHLVCLWVVTPGCHSQPMSPTKCVCQFTKSSLIL